jgi:hypothetical protein
MTLFITLIIAAFVIIVYSLIDLEMDGVFSNKMQISLIPGLIYIAISVWIYREAVVPLLSNRN